jgi:hypothetical protein
MKYGTKRKSAAGQANKHRESANRCRALVQADGTAIRKKIRTDYEKALQDLDKSRNLLNQFHEQDLPKFTLWISKHMGALITELRELGRKVAEDGALISMVHEEAFYAGCSLARAYQSVMNPPPEPEEKEQEKGRDVRDSYEEQRGEFENSSGKKGDTLEDMIDELFEAFAPGQRPNKKSNTKFMDTDGEDTRFKPVSRIKEIYRKLARMLHPDAQEKMTAQKEEWWHQTQAAYEAGDEAQLEVILTLCEIDERGTVAQTSVSLLQRITAQLKSSIREIKRRISGLQRDPAWGFSKRSDHDAFLIKIRREVEMELNECKRRHSEMQEIISRWKATAEKANRAGTRRKRKSAMG